jgi:hypothetical protein
MKVIYLLALFCVFLIAGCGQDEVVPNHGTDPTTQNPEPNLLSLELDIIQTYRETYNPFPNVGTSNGYQVVWNAFPDAHLTWQKRIETKLPVDLAFEQNLVWGGFESYRAYYLKYLEKNNLVHPGQPYRMVVYGVNDVINPDPKNVLVPAGVTFPMYQNNPAGGNYQNPPLVWMHIGYIRNFLHPSWNTEQQNKFILKVAAHEVAHGRGLGDKTIWYTINDEETDNVHYQIGHPCHSTHTCHMDGQVEVDYCMMQQGSSAGLDVIYPPRMCYKHLQLTIDSLRFYQRRSMDLPNTF